MTNLKMDKRAYLAYMSELLLKQKNNPNLILEDDIPIDQELKWIENHINDIDFIIKIQDQNI